MRSKRVLVAGGGVIGLCCAYFLRERGHEVTVIDRANEDDPRGCSYGNAGMIVPSHFIPLAAPGMTALALRWMWHPSGPFALHPSLDQNFLSWIWRFMRASSRRHVERSAPLLRDLNLLSRGLYETLVDGIGDFGLERRGLLMLCQTKAGLAHERVVAEKANQLGMPADILTAEEVAALDPGARMAIEGAVYFPRDCHLTPERLMAALRRKLRALGVTFRFGLGVTGFQRGQRELLAAETTGGLVPADEFVLAAGTWSPKLARSIRIRLPILGGKGYSLTLLSPRKLPAICSILTEARVAVTPMSGSLRVGGTMELGASDGSVSRERVAGIIRSFTEYFPDYTSQDFADVSVWSGLRPCAPDGLPLLGRLGGFRNLTAATGHAMMGLSLGPATGLLAAQIISDEKPALSLELLNPNRFN